MMHPEAERLVRMEVSKVRGQAQHLDDKLKLFPASSLDDGAARTLVDDAARIIATLTSIIARLSSQQQQRRCGPQIQELADRSPPPQQLKSTAASSDTSLSDDDPPAKKRRIKSQQAADQSELIPDDGHSWRKYGQKDILGSRHPKSYYRCTHKRESGCPAIKYVQRSDTNPSSFHITYRGEHTCSQQQLQNPALIPARASSINSVCLRINSEGGLQLGASGPTVIPSPLRIPADHKPLVRSPTLNPAELLEDHASGAVLLPELSDSMSMFEFEFGEACENVDSLELSYHLMSSDSCSVPLVDSGLWPDCTAY